MIWVCLYEFTSVDFIQTDMANWFRHHFSFLGAANFFFLIQEWFSIQTLNLLIDYEGYFSLENGFHPVQTQSSSWDICPLNQLWDLIDRMDFLACLPMLKKWSPSFSTVWINHHTLFHLPSLEFITLCSQYKPSQKNVSQWEDRFTGK